MLSRFEKYLAARKISGVRVQQADVLRLQGLPPSWTNYDLILSASMLEYVSKEDFPSALAALRDRLSTHGKLIVMITRKTPETKIFIEWLWHANRYTKPELLRAFARAGLRNPVFHRFPVRYFWLNRANYVVTMTS
jgi:cyclopropane fatty-acyl-phospholipid synthase-like methyltransferase